MYTNVGSADRVIRVILGIIAIVFAVWQFQSIHYLVAYILVLFGLLWFVTGLVGWSPFYSMLNYSTRKRGVEKITLEEIERAVKENQVPKAQPIEKLKPVKVSSLASDNSKSKKSTTTGKSKSKKKTTTKKAPAKKSAAKKTTKTSATTSGSSSKKKSTTKKAPAKKTATKKSATKKGTAKKKTSAKKK